MAVKNKLGEILEKRGISQTWLANQVGVTRGTMSNLINNRYTTSIDIAYKIAKVLDLSLDDIFYQEDEK